MNLGTRNLFDFESPTAKPGQLFLPIAMWQRSTAVWTVAVVRAGAGRLYSIAQHM